MRGLAHITGDGLLNLLRLNDAVGYEIDAPLPPQPVFGLIQERGGDRRTPRCRRCSTWAPASAASWRAGDAERALELLARTTPARRANRRRVTAEAGVGRDCPTRACVPATADGLRRPTSRACRRPLRQAFSHS